MNWRHLKAFVWLRWRLSVNQTKRSGPGGAILSTILTLLMTAGSVVMLLVGFGVGFFALATGPSRAVMVVWAGAVVGFVFFWLIGLVSELQRADAISLDRFLHLPVSPSSAFLINYLGSSVSLSLILMLPGMVGMSAGLVLSRGVIMLLLFPLVAAFFLMMTAVTYQFRGWLASMMQNPRRRRAIVAIIPALFILMFQGPRLLGNLGPGAAERRAARVEEQKANAQLQQDRDAGRITGEEYLRRRRALNDDTSYQTTRLISMIAPPGWLPFGAEAAADGRVWPAVAGIFGMALIGVMSLRRAYATTLRLYTGDFDTGRRRAPPAVAAASGQPITVPASAGFMERRLPRVSDRVSSVAVMSFRSWMRAPEMKMTLLTPVIMLVFFSRMFTGQGNAAELVRPLAAWGFAVMVLVLGMVGPAGNQWGYDRAGFRAFVLSPANRRDLLLGRNLSLLPFGVVMVIVAVGVSQWFNPMRWEHFAGVLVHLVPTLLVFGLGANVLSIVAPLALKPGSGMPAPHQGARSFGSLLFVLSSPLTLGLTLIPLGLEAVLSMWGFDWFPAYLVFGVVQAIVAVWLYRLVLDWQGELLQRRELRILEIVGGRAE